MGGQAGRYLCLGWLLLAWLPAERALPQAATPGGVSIARSVMIPMGDGVRLSTDLYLPADESRRHGAVLLRTPYSKNHEYEQNPILPRLVAAGIAVAIQDIRGRYESEGRFRPGRNERSDAYETVGWLARQSWSNGRIGSIGCSYAGELQLTLAAADHPNHVAAFPMASASGYYTPGRAWMAFDGGVFELAEIGGWFYTDGSEVYYGPPAWVDRGEWFRSPAARLYRQKPEIDMAGYREMFDALPSAALLERQGMPPNEFREFISSGPDADYFRSMDFAQAGDKFNVPAVFVDSWYDYGVAETLQLYRLFGEHAQSERARNNQFLILAPSTHCGYGTASEHTIIGERDLGDARIDLDRLQLDWFDYWLNGNGEAFSGIPKVQYYLMGRNEWRHADRWPVPGSHAVSWYLGGSSAANSRLGGGTLEPDKARSTRVDRFVYDPSAPVPTLGGQTCCTGLPQGAGAYDQAAPELRHDVLVYSSAPLTQGIEVTGTLQAVLYVSSSAADTDFTAKLVDVYPDGRAFNVQEGAFRMRYREGWAGEARMQPGKVYEIHIDMHATSNYFGPGHRLRLDVSSSNFPRWERNLNTGGNIHEETAWVSATNAVHHGPAYPSRLVLTVVGDPAERAGNR